MWHDGNLPIGKFLLFLSTTIVNMSSIEEIEAEIWQQQQETVECQWALAEHLQKAKEKVQEEKRRRSEQQKGRRSRRAARLGCRLG